MIVRYMLIRFRRMNLASMGEFTLRKDTRHATWPGGAVTLSRQEYAIMDALHSHSGPMPRDALLERIWGPDQHGSTSRLSTSLRRMKLKLGDAPIVIEFQSSGYVLRPQPKTTRHSLTDRHIHGTKLYFYGWHRSAHTTENQLLTHPLHTPMYLSPCRADRGHMGRTGAH